MPKGPGKYDDVCVEVMEKTQSDCAIILVINGKNGNGFSVNSISMDIVMDLPLILRHMANLIEDDYKRKESVN